jgi:hypothetical protein
MDATVWPVLAGGWHTCRDTVAAIERTGFTEVISTRSARLGAA